MNKKGISLIILVITLIVIIIIASTVVFTGLDFNNTTNSVKFETSIELIEKTIRKEQIKGKFAGTTIEEYEKNENNEQNRFSFTQAELESMISEISNISPIIQINSEKEEYYLLNSEDLKSIGLNEIYKEYLINYKNGYVFCLEPIIINNEKIYTTQFVQDWKIEVANGYPVTIDSRRENILNYKIYGNTIQSGNPTPSTPISIKSVGETNLYDFAVENIGSYVLSTDGSSRYGYNLGVLEAGEYTVSYELVDETDFPQYIYLRYKNIYDNTWGSAVYLTTSRIEKKSYTFDADGESEYYFYLASAAVNNLNTAKTRMQKLTNIQLEKGDNKTEYIENGTYRISIKVVDLEGNSSTFNLFLDEPLRSVNGISDYIDFKNQKVVRRVKEIALTGEENWILQWNSIPDIFKLNISDMYVEEGFNNKFKGYCNIYTRSNHSYIYTKNIDYGICNIYEGKPGIAIRDIDCTNLDEFKQKINDLYNSGKPMILNYLLKEPVEEFIEIPELIINKGINTITVEKEVQPSNIEIEYYSQY